jgi:hypothetical protein
VVQNIQINTNKEPFTSTLSTVNASESPIKKNLRLFESNNSNNKDFKKKYTNLMKHIVPVQKPKTIKVDLQDLKTKAKKMNLNLDSEISREIKSLKYDVMNSSICTPKSNQTNEKSFKSNLPDWQKQKMKDFSRTLQSDYQTPHSNRIKLNTKTQSIDYNYTINELIKENKKKKTNKKEIINLLNNKDKQKETKIQSTILNKERNLEDLLKLKVLRKFNEKGEKTTFLKNIQDKCRKYKDMKVYFEKVITNNY